MLIAGQEHKRVDREHGAAPVDRLDVGSDVSSNNPSPFRKAGPPRPKLLAKGRNSRTLGSASATYSREAGVPGDGGEARG